MALKIHCLLIKKDILNQVFQGSFGKNVEKQWEFYARRSVFESQLQFRQIDIPKMVFSHL